MASEKKKEEIKEKSSNGERMNREIKEEKSRAGNAVHNDKSIDALRYVCVG